MGARSELRLPGPEVVNQLLVVPDLIRNLQGKAAGGMGRQVDQRHLVELAALELRQVLAGAVGERQPPAGLGIGGQGGGQRLADRADFEERIARNGLPGFPGRNAVVVEPPLAIDGQRDGQARNAVLLHDGAGGLLHCGVDSARFGARRCEAAKRETAREQKQPCAELADWVHRGGPLLVNSGGRTWHFRQVAPKYLRHRVLRSAFVSWKVGLCWLSPANRAL
ncbi:hypothetical protein D3C85_684100 [compost metagenome]